MSRKVARWIREAKPKFCAVCGRTDDLQYDHWIPVAMGGKDEPNNIIVLCAQHHQERHEQGGAVKHNKLVKEGIAKARERGVKVGRRPTNHERIMRLIAEHSTQFNNVSDPGYTPYTEHEIMEMAGVKGVCYNKCKRELLDAIKSETWEFEWSKPTEVKERALYDMVVKRIREGGAL